MRGEAHQARLQLAGRPPLAGDAHVVGVDVLALDSDRAVGDTAAVGAQRTRSWRAARGGNRTWDALDVDRGSRVVVARDTHRVGGEPVGGVHAAGAGLSAVDAEAVGGPVDSHGGAADA